jgi:hypothetical protein
MAEVLLFHHAHGLTSGVRDFAERLRRAGHLVHVPDLYAGQVFDELEAGMAYAQEVGFGEIIERGRVATGGLPGELVYAGFSLGVLPAQMLAQSRPARSSRRPRTPSCSSTRATSTCSPTPVCRPTTSPTPDCSPNACSASWTASRPDPGARNDSG